MSADDQGFEEFLRGFEPMRPRPLPSVKNDTPDWQRLAAAAVLVVAVGGSLWVAARGPRPNVAQHVRLAPTRSLNETPAVRLNLSTALTRIALEDTERFDAQMNAAAQLTLPRFDRADSTLRALAKE
jgi:hypothetical protein